MLDMALHFNQLEDRTGCHAISICSSLHLAIHLQVYSPSAMETSSCISAGVGNYRLVESSNMPCFSKRTVIHNFRRQDSSSS